MNDRRHPVALATTLLVAATLLGAPLAGPAPAPSCPAATGPDRSLDAAGLGTPVDLERCGLAGAVVRAGSLAAAVPARDGESVTAAGSGRDGHPAVLTVSVEAGAVHVRLAGAARSRHDGAARPRHQSAARPRHQSAARPRHHGRAGAGPGDAPGPRPDGGHDARPGDGGPRAADDRSARPDPPGVERIGRVDPSPTRSGAQDPRQTETSASNVRCTDSAGTWLGTRWRIPYRWALRGGDVPAYLGSTDAVRGAVQAAAAAIDDGRNDCGFNSRLRTSQRYTGDTDRDADIRTDGTCGQRDERNVVAFGDLDGGLLALTCLWWSRGRTVEADIRISRVPNLFALEPAPGCTDRWDLQGTLTHEFGHVFGLGHVPFAEHGDLTMSDGLPACSTRFRSLGLGDYQTLLAQYGAD